MNDLFRFVALRSAEKNNANKAIDLTVPSSTLQEALANLHRHGGRVDAVKQARSIVETYIRGPEFIKDISKSQLKRCFDDFNSSITETGQNLTFDYLEQLVKKIFKRSASDLLNDTEFQKENKNIFDTIIALFICPNELVYSISELVQIVRLTDLIERVAKNDKELDKPEVVIAALSKTLLLPVSIFPLRPDLPKPVGVGDLLVVKQHMKRYELGEISNIENILKGENRKKTIKHTLSMDQTQVTETEKTTETTNELQTTERFDLKTETENVIKEDVNTKAGVSISSKYGSVQINANADVAYGLSKTNSTKAAVDHAKDVTSRAASKVTERIRQQVTTRTVETFEEAEEHGFDNATGQNVTGVYQWVNKVYEAQIFNYGKRLMFDLTVPEPAAFLLDSVQAKSQKETIKPPDPFALILADLNGPVAPPRPVTQKDLGPDGFIKPEFTTRPITPDDLEPNPSNLKYKYFGIYASKYGASGIKALPDEIVTVSKGLSGTKDQNGTLSAADNLTIPTGYRAVEIAVQGEFNPTEGNDDIDGDEFMWVFVGKSQFVFKLDQHRDPKTTKQCKTELQRDLSNHIYEVQYIPIAVETYQAKDFAITIDVKCQLADAALAQWKIDTHSAILQAYLKQVSDYEDKRAAQVFQNSAQELLGGNPDQNRQIERTELKKLCIALLSGSNIQYQDANLSTKDFCGLQGTPYWLPLRPDAEDQGRFIRFFEQVFEWENIMYIFYPYFWGRKETWKEQSLRNNTDPLFAEFLKAGAARVVIPVSLQMEADLRYFLLTGQVWSGGGLPEITDPSYLPITEEVKERDSAPGDEQPQGDPWEVSLPTTFIKLRVDDTLPLWNKFVVEGKDVWVPGRMQNDIWVPDYGKIDASGNWCSP